MDASNVNRLTQLLAGASAAIEAAYDAVKAARDEAEKVPHTTPAERTMWRLTCSALTEAEIKLQSSYDGLGT